VADHALSTFFIDRSRPGGWEIRKHKRGTTCPYMPPFIQARCSNFGARLKKTKRQERGARGRTGRASRGRRISGKGREAHCSSWFRVAQPPPSPPFHPSAALSHTHCIACYYVLFLRGVFTSPLFLLPCPSSCWLDPGLLVAAKAQKSTQVVR